MTGYGQFCSMARAHEALGGRWTLLVVREILSGSRRFNDIRRGIPRISRTVLSERLRALAYLGAVARIDGPHGPEYALTDAGERARCMGTKVARETSGRRGSRSGTPARRHATARPFRCAAQGPHRDAV